MLTFVTFISYFVNTIYPALFTLYVMSVFGWNSAAAGVSLMIVGASAALEGAFLVQPMIRRLGERGSILVGLVGWSLGLVVFGLAPDGYVFMAGLIPGIASAAANPAMGSIMSRLVSPSEQGELQGSLGALRGICDMAGPVAFSSWLFATGMRPEVGLPGLPWLAGATLIVIGLAAAWRGTDARKG